MKIRRTITIRGRRWQIKLVKTVPDKEHDLHGLCDFENFIIYIKKDLPKHTLLETLIHEYAHVLWNEAGLNEDLPEVAEHAMITSIAKDMVLNSSFFRALFASVKKSL